MRRQGLCRGPCREARPSALSISPPVWGLFGSLRPRSLISPRSPPPLSSQASLPCERSERLPPQELGTGSLATCSHTENSTGQEPAGWPIPTAASSSAGGCGLTPRESLLSLVFLPLGRRGLTPNVGAMDRGWGEEPPNTSGFPPAAASVHLEMPEFLGLALSGFPGLLRKPRWALRLWRRVVISARRSAGAGAREVSGSVFALPGPAGLRFTRKLLSGQHWSL